LLLVMYRGEVAMGVGIVWMMRREAREDWGLGTIKSLAIRYHRRPKTPNPGTKAPKNVSAFLTRYSVSPLGDLDLVN